MGRIWDDIISEQDKEIYRQSGYGEVKIGFGAKPAFVIIDVNYNFTGDKPEPILESIKRFPNSCGEGGWVAVRHIASLLPLMHEKKIPVIYLTRDTSPRPEGWIEIKSARTKETDKPENNEIVREIAPQKGDIVVRKVRNSMFFGTPMPSILNALKVDTLLICGTATSGCVRASVIEAFAYNYRVGIIEECTFDRGEVSHKVNLFDMNAKYGDVVSIDEIREYVRGL